MNESRHTPGPWHATFGTIYAEGSVDTFSGSVLIPVAYADDLCQTDADGRTATLSGDRHANACLIAAAPDLRAALVEVLAMCRRQEDFNDDRDGLTLARAEAAIAKAEGRS